MKKSLSAVLAILMILSCFTFAGGSVFASAEYPKVWNNVSKMDSLFSLGVDCQPAKVTNGTYYGETATKYEPTRVPTMISLNGSEVDASEQICAIEGYDRVPVNNSIEPNKNRIDARIYKYVAVKYYYEVTHGGTPSATKMIYHGLGNPQIGRVMPMGDLVTNKWAYMVFNIGSAANDSKYMIWQFHLFPFISPNGQILKGKDIPEGESMILEGMYYATSLEELGIVDSVEYKANDLVGEDSIALGVCDTALYDAETVIDLTADLKDGHKYAVINYAAVGEGTGSFKLNIGGKDYEVTKTVADTTTTDKFVAGKWATAVIDISAAGASTAQTLTVTPAEGQSIFVESVSFAMDAPNKGLTYDYFPSFDSNGDVIPAEKDIVKTGAALSDLTAQGFGVEICEFTGGDAAKATPAAGAASYSISIPVVSFMTEWQPYIRIEYYLHGAGQTFTGKSSIKIGDTVVEADQDIVADNWGVATFNVSDILNTQVDTIEFMPYGSNAVTDKNKLYIKSVTVSRKENTSAPTYQKPDLDENGDVRGYAYTGDTNVAYYREGGTYTGTVDKSTSLQPYGDLNAAVSALDKVGGGTLVLMSDIYLTEYKADGSDGHTYSHFPTHTNLIKVRGTDIFRATVYINWQTGIGGDTWFQKNIHFTNSPDSVGGDTGIMFQGNKGIFGEEGGADDDITWNNNDAYMCIIGGGDGGKHPKVDLTFHSGKGPREIRVLGAWGKGVIQGDANLVINGGDFTGTTLKGMHGSNGTEEDSYVGGDYNVTINGGKFGSSFVDLVGNKPVWIAGDLNVKIGGGTFAKSLSVSSEAHISGTKTLDILEYPTVSGKVSTYAFNEVYKVTSEQSGENVKAGVTAVTSGTTSKTSFGGIIKAVGDGLTLSSDYTEPAHKATITFTGTKLTIADGVTYTLGGDVNFNGITIETGVGSKIVSGDNALVFGENTVVSGPVGIEGTDVTFTDNVTVYADELHDNFPAKKSTLIDLGGYSIVSPTLDAETTITRVITPEIKGGAIAYYVTSLSSEETIPGKMKIVDNTGVEEIIENFTVNKWDVALFDASKFANASYLKFIPMFETALPEGFHLYIHSVTFSENPIAYSIDYGDVVTDRFGEVIAPVDDIIIPGINWNVYTSGRENIDISEKPFAEGNTAMLAPVEGGVPNVTYRLENEVNGEWQPYVKVEYYLHSNEGDELPADIKMAAKFGENEEIIEADRTIVANQSAIAIFDVSALPENFKEITLYPYSQDSSAFDEKNKIYMGNMKISKEKDETVPEYKIPKLDEDGLLLPYKYNPGDGKPVVYVSSTGTYTGGYKGSTDSTKAYKTIEDAFAALKGVGGYVILCEDYDQHVNGNTTKALPEHTDMITVRGIQDEDNPNAKVKLNFYYMTNGNGPLTFENIWLNWVKSENPDHKWDYSLQMGDKDLLVLGKEGVADDVILSHDNKVNDKPMITTRNVVVNGCAVGDLRTHTFAPEGNQGAESLDYVFNEYSSFGPICIGWGQITSASVDKDVNITINGGKAAAAFTPFKFAPNIKNFKIGGNLNIKICGGDFSAVQAKSIKARTDVVTIDGKATLDIIDYSGDSEELLSKFDLTTFDTISNTTVYVSSSRGDDTAAGDSVSNPVKTLKQAVKNLSNVPGKASEIVSCGGRIVILDYVIDGEEIVYEDGEAAPSSDAEILIIGDSDYEGITVNSGSFLNLAFPTRFKGIKFNVASELGVPAGICTNGHSCVMDKGVEVTSENGEYLTIIAGSLDENVTVPSANITINSGKYSDIIGSYGDVSGNVEISVKNAEVNGTVIGSMKDVKGDVTISVEGGNLENIIGAEGDISGDVEISTNGSKVSGSIKGAEGSVSGDVSVKASNTTVGENICGAEGSVSGNVEISANDTKVSGSVYGAGENVGKDVSILFDGSSANTTKVDGDVIGAKGNIKGNSEIVINNGTFNGTIASGNADIGGLTNISINKGVISGTVVGGSLTGNVKQSTQVSINGGKLLESAKVIGGNATKGTSVNGDIIVVIADVPAVKNMGDNSIVPGYSNSVITTTMLDVSNLTEAEYNRIKDKAPADEWEENGSVITPEPNPENYYPASGVIWILQEIVTKKDKNGLVKNPPLRINQTAEQKAIPVVVSPKQLNLTVDGGDQALLAVQLLGDNLTETIRLTPNTNPKHGGSIVLDGWNIDGRGVNVSKHMWAEVIYYYTVPEEQEQAATHMSIRGCQNYNPMGEIVSTPLVANKWATALFDLSNVSATTGITDDMKQYHFSPYGGLSARDVPPEQFMDIISLTFYSDKPSTSISGGPVPGAKMDEILDSVMLPGASNEPNIVYNPLVTKGPDLTGQVDRNGAFTGTADVKDGVEVGKIVPNGMSNTVMLIEGYDRIPGSDASPKGVIDTRKYRYAILKYYYESKNEDVYKMPVLTLYAGGLSNDANVVNPGKFDCVPYEGTEIKANQWSYAVFDIYPVDQNKYKTMQFHLSPFGNVSGNKVPDGDIVYIESLTWYTSMPKLFASEEETEDGESDPSEIELTDMDIEPKEPTVVPLEMLRYSADADKTFIGKPEVFQEKNVIAITPDTYSNKPIRIDALDAITAEEGRVSLKNYKYAVISYYFKTEKGTETKAPSIDLFSVGIKPEEGAIGEKTFEAEEGLKANQWATATIRLKGTLAEYLSKGFILKPFGNMSGTSFSNGDTLYIESVSFVTEAQ